MSFWNRNVVPHIIGCACGSKPIRYQRKKVVPKAYGIVVEPGFGSGTNLEFYDAAKVTKVFAVEPAREMLALNRDKRRTDIAVEEIVAGAEAMPVADGIADTVVFTYALCTIPDAAAALAEAKRVLKPGGLVLFCEHGLAPDAKVQKTQRGIEPFWKWFAGGCHLTRDTVGMLEAAGFTVSGVETMYLPSTPRFAGWNVWGEARVA